MEVVRRGVPVLEGERVRLRPLRDSDRAERVALGRDAEFVRLNGGVPANAERPFTEADGARWYAARPESLRWAMEFEGELIGEARLDRFDEELSEAWFAIGIYNRRWWDSGLGSEATGLVLGHAFGERDIREVRLRVLSFNERAIAVYRKLGFVEFAREPVEIAGEQHEDVLMRAVRG
jgi:RimJ/RimL family protein N-acetyltransferase